MFFLASNGNNLEGNGVSGNQYGIYLYGSSQNTLNQNTVSNNRGDGFVLVSSSNLNTLTANEITNNGKGVFVFLSEGNTLNGNNLKNNDYGIWLNNSGDNSIFGNSVLSSGNYGVSLVESHGNTLSENKITGSGIINLYLESSESNTVSENNAIEGSEYGIFLYRSSGNMLQGNVVGEHEINGIILIDQSDRNNVSGNDLRKSLIAIFIKYSSQNVVTENNLENNSYGIYLYEAPDSVVQGNTLNSNENAGIAVTKWSDRTSITDNGISGHIYGIFLYKSEDLRISGNNFSNNQEDIYTPPNLVQNNGFEFPSKWHASATLYAKAKVQDRSDKRSGIYSGMTDTRPPGPPFPSGEVISEAFPSGKGQLKLVTAKLIQNLEQTPLVSNIIDKPDSIELWLKNLGFAKDGGKVVEVQVSSVEGRVLHYRWRLDDSPLPKDTPTHKYIDMGTSLPENRWVRLERNLYADWVKLKGMPQTDRINKITLYNEGAFSFQPIRSFNGLERMPGRSALDIDFKFYGQKINWDSVYIDFVSA